MGHDFRKCQLDNEKCQNKSDFIKRIGSNNYPNFNYLGLRSVEDDFFPFKASTQFNFHEGLANAIVSRPGTLSNSLVFSVKTAQL